ncbi:MAG: chemotaxis protein CheB [Myxococcaceae bacterium]
MRTRSTPFRVLLVDQSLKLGQIARPLFESPELEAASTGCTFRDMPAEVNQRSPDVIVMDLTEGSEEGFASIEAVMAEKPRPILVLHEKDASSTNPFQALDLGALDVSERPKNPPAEYWRNLSKQVALLAQVAVVKHVKGRRRPSKPERADPGSPSFPLVAIAASLGGPKALATLLRALPRDLKAPVCIVQHISEGFTVGMAQWLSFATALKVVEAQHGVRMEPGTVYIGPSGRHFCVARDGRIQLDDTPPLMGFRPSCDRLLESAAAAFGRRAIGIVLTGMGRDGARGLKVVRDSGGHTIAQDEASCVVFGMPREAIALGGAERVLALDEIAAQIVGWVDAC